MADLDYRKKLEEKEERTTTMKESVAYFPKIGLSFEPLGDRIVIEEDVFRTGYECKKCDGETQIECPSCKNAPEGFYCSYCRDARVITCPECQGRGGLLVTPEKSEKRPTSGIIVAVGPDVIHLKVGDRVMFPFFSGQDIVFKQKVSVRFLYEKEVICKIYGKEKPRTI